MAKPKNSSRPTLSKPRLGFAVEKAVAKAKLTPASAAKIRAKASQLLGK